MVERYSVRPWDIRRADMVPDPEGEYVSYSDYEALQKKLAERTAAHHRTSHKAVKRLRALWREKQAAEARADILARRVEGLEAALEMIAGKRPCIDNLMGNVDIALAALKQKDGGNG